MKKNFSTEFIVGIFGLVALIIIIYLSLQVNDKGLVGSNANTYHARFDSVSGLVMRTPLEVAGIMVGFVDEIKLEGTRALVKLRIHPDLKIYKNARLSIKDRGVLGDKFILVEPGDDSYPLLKSRDYFENTKSTSDFEGIAGSLEETAKLVKELLSGDNPEGALGQTIVNLRNTTENLEKLVSQHNQKIESILANTDHFTRDLKQVMEENKGQIKEALVAFRDMAGAMQSQLGDEGNINETLENLNKIIAKVEKGEGTIGRLLNDESTIEKINETMDGVNYTIGAFKRIQLGIRYRAEYLMSSNKLQNLIGMTIAPSPDKYLLFELVDAPVGDTSVTQTTVSSGGNILSSTETRTTNDRLLLNIQLAKRFWDLTVRAGMMRNEGGIGLDYSLFDDKLVLSGEAFNFSRPDDDPQLRAYATLTLFNNLLLTGGVDDLITNTNRENYFVGLGIQLTDNDFKRLLPALGAAF